MREIKFRAWDNRNKRMYPFELIELPYNENVNLDGQFDGLVNREYLFMQYTGLLDKNGEEIYEGDIVSVFDYDTEFLGHGKIVFYDFSWCIEWICKDKNFTMMFSEWYEETKTVEVIGNIYENQELLKGEK